MTEDGLYSEEAVSVFCLSGHSNGLDRLLLSKSYPVKLYFMWSLIFKGQKGVSYSDFHSKIHIMKKNRKPLKFPVFRFDFCCFHVSLLCIPDFIVVECKDVKGVSTSVNIFTFNLKQ